MRLQKKPVETTATNNYAETTSTEVNKAHCFFVNYVKKTVRCGNFLLSATVHIKVLYSQIQQNQRHAKCVTAIAAGKFPHMRMLEQGSYDQYWSPLMHI